MRTRMHVFNWMVIAGIVNFAAAVQPASARGTIVEVPVDSVFIPEKGYDDNDSIGAVVTGVLPNPCYTINGVGVSKKPDGRTIQIKQYAYKEMEGPCANADDLSGELNDPTPFTTEVTLGRLKARNYQLQFNTRAFPEAMRPFNVEKAAALSIDNFDYAVISNVEVDPLQPPGVPLHATLVGVMTSRCVRLQRPLRIEHQGDVTLILPVLAGSASLDSQGNEPCRTPETLFRETVEIGTYAPGSYLLHVRSRNGQALNRVFKVVALSEQ